MMQPLEHGDEHTEPESLEIAHDHFLKRHIDRVEPYGTATVGPQVELAAGSREGREGRNPSQLSGLKSPRTRSRAFFM